MFFTEEKIDKYLNDLQDFIYRNAVEIKEFRHYRGDPVGAEAPGFDDSGWDLFQVGSVWGGADVTAWFRTSIEIPGDWRQSRVALYLDLGRGHHGGLAGAESLLFINGQPVKGLDVNHKEVMLKSEWLQQDKLEIAIKAFSGLERANMFKQSTLVNDAGQDRKQFKTARLVKIDEQTEDFYYRARTALETLRVLKEGSLDHRRLLNFLNQAINTIDFRRPGSPEFYESIARANQGLKDDLARYKPESENKPLVTAVGHSHIDVAWLWRLCHTREKCSRTFSSVLKLMEQYPEYQFLQSMPQLYEYIKEDYPEIYEQIKEKVKQGDWEVTGGMWVEADCNLSSGESLVRQFLFGTRFMKEEFDVECNLLWLPDVFGYSWALPQIIKKSGLRYFMTTKISWSQFNRPEYDTFSWRGIDGTEVLTHFITTPVVNEERPFYTYNGILDPESVQGIWDNYRQKDINDELLLAFGWGDGGGGPTKKMIETGRRMQEMPGLPEVEFGKAEPYYRRLEERVADNPQLPVWDGELYLEYHRGTYTSQAEVKKNNRKSEILYQNLEKLGSLARLMMGDYQYPQGDINQGWKTILRNQFHDIIPGSSIREVYEDSEEEFAQIKETGTDLIQGALTDLAGEIELEGEKLLVFNPLSWAREGIVTLPYSPQLAGKAFVDEEGKQLPARVVGKGERQLRIKVPRIPALGYRAFKLVEGDIDYPDQEQLRVTAEEFENKFYNIKLNDRGQITSIYDKEARRQVLPEGRKANVLQAFEDKPMNFDAWDIDIYYQEKEYQVDNLQGVRVVESGPERGIIEFTWDFLDSTISQQLIVYAEQRRIDFKTDIDWHQHQILLKAAFPVDVRTTKATYEIQFGNVERPTHWNTSWDYAKFETAGHKWADLSERDYGVSLLNDCKYGYDIKDQTMRLTLLKSGIYPDPQADQGHHSFTYSLYPHQGDWYQGNTTVEAYELNTPLLAVTAQGQGGDLPVSRSLVELKADSTILETVKKAEDDDSLILRFYEYGNRSETVRVNMGEELESVAACNLMEDDAQPLEFTGNQFDFEIKPYEIRTFKVRLN